MRKVTKRPSCFSDRRFAFQTALPGGEGRDSEMDDAEMEMRAGHCPALNPF